MTDRLRLPQDDSLRMSEVIFVEAPRPALPDGVAGWSPFPLNRKRRIDALQARRSRDSRVVFSWPTQHDSKGGKHFVVEPLTDEARLQIENQLRAALGLQLGLKGDAS